MPRYTTCEITSAARAGSNTPVSRPITAALTIAQARVNFTVVGSR
jgi:hypothetical protein